MNGYQAKLYYSPSAEIGVSSCKRNRYEQQASITSQSITKCQKATTPKVYLCLCTSNTHLVRSHTVVSLSSLTHHYARILHFTCHTTLFCTCSYIYGLAIPSNFRNVLCLSSKHQECA